MNDTASIEQLRALTEQLMLFTTQNEHHCSQEELLFSVNCLLRSLHAALSHAPADMDTSYIETRLCTVYNLVTGKMVFPF